MDMREEVDRLKADWEADPCFDLADIEGFEAFSDELKAFQADTEARWEREREERRQSEIARIAKQRGVTLEGAKAIYEAEAALEGYRDLSIRNGFSESQVQEIERLAGLKARIVVAEMLYRAEPAPGQDASPDLSDNGPGM